MAQAIQTPYGPFKAFSKATQYVMQTDAAKFIQTYPGYNFPYTDSAKKYEGNNSAQHYIYCVIKHLCDDPKVTDWIRV